MLHTSENTILLYYSLKHTYTEQKQLLPSSLLGEGLLFNYKLNYQGGSLATWFVTLYKMPRKEKNTTVAANIDQEHASTPDSRLVS